MSQRGVTASPGNRNRRRSPADQSGSGDRRKWLLKRWMDSDQVLGSNAIRANFGPTNPALSSKLESRV